MRIKPSLTKYSYLLSHIKRTTEKGESKNKFIPTLFMDNKGLGVTNLLKRNRAGIVIFLKAIWVGGSSIVRKEWV